MLKKITSLMAAIFFVTNICGCFAVIAGGAAGGGTAAWLSNKLTQEVNASYDRTISASEAALKSLNCEVKSEKKQGSVAQLKSDYTDGKEIWIDIHKVTEKSTKVEVRVGAVNPDKEAAQKILKAIQNNL